MPFFRSKQPALSPVLVVDALGIAHRIATKDKDVLLGISEKLDQQYYKFRAKVPHKLVFVTKRRVLGTRDFSTIRLNDMFVLFSERPTRDPALRYLISASILYHQLLLSGFIPRGALGYGLVLRRGDVMLGRGFVDAYHHAEKRDQVTKDICAIQVSVDFLRVIPNTEHTYRLLCLYEDTFFLNPMALTDPDLGAFDADRIMSLLERSQTNQSKMTATKRFLDNLEDYDAALQPGSRSRELAGWGPNQESSGGA